ncbi:hypothetical protein [Pedobacter roseus]|uniref:Uncharacterized protein n=1 Tax=Pedobacter roseus TaxID=336820 RepID=A0A7G9QI31_9SPHI|nr:hypothetical protein [Pedobacter roseus]QNN43006.1 hypothetical protein H9L23_02550 [Pedobacter roseus]
MSTANNLSKDLQKFIEKFEPNKFKVMRSGIEVRGMNNIHDAIETAKRLIEKLKLNLQVSHNAEMVSYGAFEVNTL